METKNDFIDRRTILGLLLIIAGSLLLSENMGWLTWPNLSIHSLIFSWKTLLIVIGILSLSHKGKSGFGFTLIAIGVYFHLSSIFNFSWHFDQMFWPAMIVVVGILIIFRKKKQPLCTTANKGTSSSDIIDEVNIFGGCERKISSQNFQGGKITSIFGGSTYDMLESQLNDGKNVLDIVNIFGGTKIIVPSDWKIHVEVISIFGGFADKRRIVTEQGKNSDKELHITGVVIFGGGEIKSF
jgi:Predicted membrane protein (DUF2154).